MEKIALKVSDLDNVATIFANEVRECDEICVRDRKGQAQSLVLKNDIPYGHKVAVVPISKGVPIKKYGEEIGVATKDIAPGEHVHVHNLDSQRGRGDLKNA